MMRRSLMLIAVVPALLAASGVPAQATPGAMGPGHCAREHVLEVNGVGKVSVRPDIADLSLAVNVQAKTADAARAGAAEAMTQVLAALKAQGLEARDLQTRWVSLYPVYAPNTPNLVVGYQVQNQISARVRDIGKTGEVLDAAVKAGGDAVRLQGLSFAIADPAAAQAKARALATEDAQAKAKQYAELLQITVGKPIRISESSGGGAPVPMVGQLRMMRAAAEAPTPVEAGEQEVTVTVEVTFAIE